MRWKSSNGKIPYDFRHEIISSWSAMMQRPFNTFWIAWLRNTKNKTPLREWQRHVLVANTYDNRLWIAIILIASTASPQVFEKLWNKSHYGSQKPGQLSQTCDILGDLTTFGLCSREGYTTTQFLLFFVTACKTQPFCVQHARRLFVF